MVHGATADRRSRALVAALGLNVLIVAGQVVAGLFAHSLGLLADAAHNVVDVAGVLLALLAVRYTRRPADEARSFGYHRATILAGLANSAAVTALTVILAIFAVRRLFEPAAVHGGLVVAAAGAAALVNLVAAWIVHEPHGHDLNTRAAVLHLAGDAAASVAVAVAGAVILVTGGTYWLDPAVSLLVGLLVTVQAVRLVRESVHVLLESTPAGLDLEGLRQRMCAVAGVVSVHDLHVWSLSSEVRAMSAHVLVAGHPTLEEAQSVGDVVKDRVAEEFRIGHTTLELECETCEPPGASAAVTCVVEGAAQAAGG